MLRHMIAGVLSAGLWLAGTSPPSADETANVFTLRGLGMSLGDLTISQSKTQNRYAINLSFSTTGPARTLAKVDIVMAAQGLLRATDLRPQRFQEQVQARGRNSDIILLFRDGIPQMQQVQTSVSTAIAKASAQPVLDPASAMWRAIRTNNPDKICNLNLSIFDGTRYTRLELGVPQPDAKSGWQCRGQLLRVAGYSPKQLRRHPRFPITLQFAATPDRQAILQSATFGSVYGPITLLRRSGP